MDPARIKDTDMKSKASFLITCILYNGLCIMCLIPKCLCYRCLRGYVNSSLSVFDLSELGEGYTGYCRYVKRFDFFIITGISQN